MLDKIRTHARQLKIQNTHKRTRWEPCLTAFTQNWTQTGWAAVSRPLAESIGDVVDVVACSNIGTSASPIELDATAGVVGVTGECSKMSISVMVLLRLFRPTPPDNARRCCCCRIGTSFRLARRCCSCSMRCRLLGVSPSY